MNMFRELMTDGNLLAVLLQDDRSTWQPLQTADSFTLMNADPNELRAQRPTRCSSNPYPLASLHRAQ